MNETEIQLQLTMVSIFEKLKIFKELLSPEQLIQYNEKINSAKEKHQQRFSELSKDSLELLDKQFS
ncbi:hypothetical protein [Flavobacterium taihuense]|uniref:Uncharacterized protein n=1 Tax=Flavobacterium taihuense TaxID=2857508 RepID=A0ABS6Y215_9FLAO|nr:hypothetical protein [Flavobacterium taihuense]MBW4362662.1 hypothetical protein [Flavobacterium taihuense]